MNNYKEYANFLKKFITITTPVRVVFDCSDGATGPVLKEIEKMDTGLSAIFIHAKPNGLFPAHGPNPLARGARKDIKAAVKKENADLGVIFDADGDRVFFIDDEGREIRADIAALLMSDKFKGPFVFDVRSGYVLRDALRKNKKKVFHSRIGHVFIKDLMRKKECDFGGEFSGHFYFKDFFFADSGIAAALLMASVVSEFVKGGSSLAQHINTLPQTYHSGELNFSVKDNEEAIRRIHDTFKSATQRISQKDGIRMEGKGFWLIARPSNTEPFIRIILEAKEKQIFDKQFKKIETVLKELK